jgi:hypothetical protein
VSLDESHDNGGDASSYYPRTWSNPGGTVVDTVVEGQVYACARPFVWNGIDVGGRMTLIRMSARSDEGQGDAWWVHSPIDLDATTKKAVDALTGGKVAYVTSPNYEHVKYAAQWKSAYPTCTLCGCPGLKAKHPEIPYDVDLGIDGMPKAWEGEFEMEWFDCERVGREAFFNEVLFYHKPSGALCVTDLFWSYPEGDEVRVEVGHVGSKGESSKMESVPIPNGTKLWKFLMDVVYKPVYKRIMVSDRVRYEASARRVVDATMWAWDVLVPCHGLVMRGDTARRALCAHLLD